MSKIIWLDPLATSRLELPSTRLSSIEPAYLQEKAFDGRVRANRKGSSAIAYSDDLFNQRKLLVEEQLRALDSMTDNAKNPVFTNRFSTFFSGGHFSSAFQPVVRNECTEEQLIAIFKNNLRHFRKRLEWLPPMNTHAFSLANQLEINIKLLEEELSLLTPLKIRVQSHFKELSDSLLEIYYLSHSEAGEVGDEEIRGWLKFAGELRDAIYREENAGSLERYGLHVREIEKELNRSKTELSYGADDQDSLEIIERIGELNDKLEVELMILTS